MDQRYAKYRDDRRRRVLIECVLCGRRQETKRAHFSARYSMGTTPTCCNGFQMQPIPNTAPVLEPEGARP